MHYRIKASVVPSQVRKAPKGVHLGSELLYFNFTSEHRLQTFLIVCCIDFLKSLSLRSRECLYMYVGNEQVCSKLSKKSDSFFCDLTRFFAFSISH